MATAAYPLSNDNIYPVLLIPVAVLGIFELLRIFDISDRGEIAKDVDDKKDSNLKGKTPKRKKS